MDTPRPEWPNLTEFESPALSVSQACEQLLHEIFDKSRRLNDEDQNYLTKDGAVYSFPVDSIEDEQGVCRSLRIKECLYTPQSSPMMLGSEARYTDAVSSSPTSARAYVVELAHLDYDTVSVTDDAIWRNFALIVSTVEHDKPKQIELFDSTTGEELSVFQSQRLKMILEMMNGALREEMASQMLLMDPILEEAESGQTDFYPDDFIAGYSCEECQLHHVLCVHYRPTLN